MNMNGDILEGQIRLLATQVIECKKEINLMREENEKYFYLIQSLMELLNKEDSRSMEVDDETARTMESFTKVKDEIEYLQYQTEQIQNNIQSIHDGFIDTSNLNSEDIIKLKQMVSEMYKLISSNENSNILSLEEKTEDTQNHREFTFKDLQNTTNISQQVNRQFMPVSDTTSHSSIQKQEINKNYDTNRFSSQYVNNQVTKKVEAEVEEKKSGLFSLIFGIRDENS